MSSSSQNLERKILEVVTYFDLFSYPLTPLEIWMNLGTKASYGEVALALRQSRSLKARMSLKNGMWHLKERGERSATVEKRQKRYLASVYKLKKARRFARLLRFVPAIEGVYACNSLGFLGSRPESDIDLFIVARRGRIWTARFFAVLLAELAGFRPKRAHAKDGLCLSFFAVDGAAMESLALKQDIYYLYWVRTLAPLLSRNGVVERFWVRNRWVSNALPQASAIRTPKSRLIHGLERKRRPWKVSRRVGSRIESALRALQLRIMPAYLKDRVNQSTAVVVNDEFLKFHDHDRRAHFREEFEQRLAALRA